MSQATAAKTYTRDFVIAMLAYAIAVWLSVSIPSTVDPALHIPLVLVPLVPAGFAMRAHLRFLSRMDELGRRIQLEALAFGFGAAGMLTFAYGFLEHAGFPQLSYTWVFPLMIVLWGVGGAIATRRYR
jgi:hypothetical protein